MGVIKAINQNPQGKPQAGFLPAAVSAVVEVEPGTESSLKFPPNKRIIFEKERLERNKENYFQHERERQEKLGVWGRLKERTLDSAKTLTCNCAELLALTGLSIKTFGLGLVSKEVRDYQIIEIEKIQKFFDEVSPSGSILSNKENSPLSEKSLRANLWNSAKLGFGLVTYPTTLLINTSLGTLSTVFEEIDRSKKGLSYAQYLKVIEETPSILRDSLNLLTFVSLSILTAGRVKVPTPMLIRSLRVLKIMTPSLGMGTAGALGEQLMRVENANEGGFNTRKLISDAICGAMSSSIFMFGMKGVKNIAYREFADMSDGTSDLFDTFAETKRVEIQSDQISIQAKVARLFGFGLKLGTAAYDLNDAAILSKKIEIHKNSNSEDSNVTPDPFLLADSFLRNGTVLEDTKTEAMILPPMITPSKVYRAHTLEARRVAMRLQPIGPDDGLQSMGSDTGIYFRGRAHAMSGEVFGISEGYPSRRKQVEKSGADSAAEIADHYFSIVAQARIDSALNLVEPISESKTFATFLEIVQAAKLGEEVSHISCHPNENSWLRNFRDHWKKREQVTTADPFAHLTREAEEVVATLLEIEAAELSNDFTNDYLPRSPYEIQKSKEQLLKCISSLNSLRDVLHIASKNDPSHKTRKIIWYLLNAYLAKTSSPENISYLPKDLRDRAISELINCLDLDVVIGIQIEYFSAANYQVFPLLIAVIYSFRGGATNFSKLKSLLISERAGVHDSYKTTLSAAIIEAIYLLKTGNSEDIVLAKKACSQFFEAGKYPYDHDSFAQAIFKAEVLPEAKSVGDYAYFNYIAQCWRTNCQEGFDSNIFFADLLPCDPQNIIGQPNRNEKHDIEEGVEPPAYLTVVDTKVNTEEQLDVQKRAIGTVIFRCSRLIKMLLAFTDDYAISENDLEKEALRKVNEFIARDCNHQEYQKHQTILSLLEILKYTTELENKSINDPFMLNRQVMFFISSFLRRTDTREFGNYSELLLFVLDAFFPAIIVGKPSKAQGIIDQQYYNDRWHWVGALAIRGGEEALKLLAGELWSIGNGHLMPQQEWNYSWTIAYAEILAEAIVRFNTDSNPELEELKLKIIQDAKTLPLNEIARYLSSYTIVDQLFSAESLADLPILCYYFNEARNPRTAEYNRITRDDYTVAVLESKYGLRASWAKHSNILARMPVFDSQNLETRYYQDPEFASQILEEATEQFFARLEQLSTQNPTRLRNPYLAGAAENRIITELGEGKFDDAKNLARYFGLGESRFRSCINAAMLDLSSKGEKTTFQYLLRRVIGRKNYAALVLTVVANEMELVKAALNKNKSNALEALNFLISYGYFNTKERREFLGKVLEESDSKTKFICAENLIFAALNQESSLSKIAEMLNQAGLIGYEQARILSEFNQPADLVGNLFEFFEEQLVPVILYYYLFWENKYQELSEIEKIIEKSNAATALESLRERIFSHYLFVLLNTRDIQRLGSLIKSPLLESIIKLIGKNRLAAAYLTVERKFQEESDQVALALITRIKEQLSSQITFYHDSRLVRINPLGFLKEVINKGPNFDPIQLVDIDYEDILAQRAACSLEEAWGVFNAVRTYHPSCQQEINLFLQQVAEVVRRCDPRIRAYIAERMLRYWVMAVDLDSEDMRIRAITADELRFCRDCTNVLVAVFLSATKAWQIVDGRISLEEKAAKILFNNHSTSDEEDSRYDLECQQIRELFVSDLMETFQEKFPLFAVLDISANEAADKFFIDLNKDRDVGYKLQKLSIGAFRCLRFYCYCLFIEYQEDIEAIKPLLKKAVNQVSKEEQANLSKYKIPVGIEFFIRPNYLSELHLSHGFASLLKHFELYALNTFTGHIGETVEFAPMPTYSFTALELAAKGLYKLMNIPALLNPCPLHLNIGIRKKIGQFEKIKYIAFILLLKEAKGMQAVSNQITEHGFSFTYLWMLKGAVCFDDAVSPFDPNAAKNQAELERASLRTARIEVSEDTKELDQNSFDKLKYAWYLAIAQQCERKIWYQFKDEFENCFKQLLSQQNPTVLKKLRNLLNTDWEEATVPESELERSPMLKALAEFFEEISKTPELADQLYYSMMAMLFKYGKTMESLLGLGSSPFAAKLDDPKIEIVPFTQETALRIKHLKSTDSIHQFSVIRDLNYFHDEIEAIYTQSEFSTQTSVFPNRNLEFKKVVYVNGEPTFIIGETEERNNLRRRVLFRYPKQISDNEYSIEEAELLACLGFISSRFGGPSEDYPSCLYLLGYTSIDKQIRIAELHASTSMKNARLVKSCLRLNLAARLFADLLSEVINPENHIDGISQEDVREIFSVIEPSLQEILLPEDLNYFKFFKKKLLEDRRMLSDINNRDHLEGFLKTAIHLINLSIRNIRDDLKRANVRRSVLDFLSSRGAEIETIRKSYDLIAQLVAKDNKLFVLGNEMLVSTLVEDLFSSGASWVFLPLPPTDNKSIKVEIQNKDAIMAVVKVAHRAGYACDNIITTAGGKMLADSDGIYFYRQDTKDKFRKSKNGKYLHASSFVAIEEAYVEFLKNSDGILDKSEENLRKIAKGVYAFYNNNTKQFIVPETSLFSPDRKGRMAKAVLVKHETLHEKIEEAGELETADGKTILLPPVGERSAELNQMIEQEVWWRCEQFLQNRPNFPEQNIIEEPLTLKDLFPGCSLIRNPGYQKLCNWVKKVYSGSELFAAKQEGMLSRDSENEDALRRLKESVIFKILTEKEVEQLEQLAKRVINIETTDSSSDYGTLVEQISLPFADLALFSSDKLYFLTPRDKYLIYITHLAGIMSLRPNGYLHSYPGILQAIFTYDSQDQRTIKEIQTSVKLGMLEIQHRRLRKMVFLLSITKLLESQNQHEDIAMSIHVERTVGEENAATIQSIMKYYLGKVHEKLSLKGKELAELTYETLNIEELINNIELRNPNDELSNNELRLLYLLLQSLTSNIRTRTWSKQSKNIFLTKKIELLLLPLFELLSEEIDHSSKLARKLRTNKSNSSSIIDLKRLILTSNEGKCYTNKGKETKELSFNELCSCFIVMNDIRGVIQKLFNDHTIKNMRRILLQKCFVDFQEIDIDSGCFAEYGRNGEVTNSNVVSLTGIGIDAGDRKVERSIYNPRDSSLMALIRLIMETGNAMGYDLANNENGLEIIYEIDDTVVDENGKPKKLLCVGKYLSFKKRL